MNKFGNKGLQRLKARAKGPSKQQGFSIGATDSNIADEKNKSLKKAGAFIAQEGVGQLIRKGLGRAAASVFGAAGMILSPTTLYAGGDSKSGATSITDKELKKQSEIIPEETSEQFQARTAKQDKL